MSLCWSIRLLSVVSTSKLLKSLTQNLSLHFPATPRVFSTRNQPVPECSSCNNNFVASLVNRDIDNQIAFYLIDGKSWTYGDLWKSVAEIGHWLTSRFGLKKGDRLAAQINKSPHAVALYLATLAQGAAYLPMNTDYTPAEVDFMLTDAQPRVFFGNPNMTNFTKLPNSVQGVDQGDLVANFGCSSREPVDLRIRDVPGEHLAQLVYTSGTTGKPKGAMVPHRALKWNCQVLCEAWDISSEDVLLHALPIFHIHGLNVALAPVLGRGGSLIFLPRFDLPEVLKWLPRANLMMGVPTFYSRLLSSPQFTKEVVAHVRLFVSGSAPLTELTWMEFKERTDHEILERYGMTEGQMVLSQPLREPRRPGNVGRPLPGVEVRISQEGTLEYKSPGVCSGYWNLPEKTRGAFTLDGFFKSGDVVTVAQDGNISIVGRESDMIISGGLNIYPKEIEDEIDRMTGVRESAVFGVPHPDFGEVAIAVIVNNNETTGHVQNNENSAKVQISGINGMWTDKSENMLKKELRSKLAAFKVPKKVLFIQELPRNSMGKVQKKELKNKYRHMFVKV